MVFGTSNSPEVSFLGGGLGIHTSSSLEWTMLWQTLNGWSYSQLHGVSIYGSRVQITGLSTHILIIISKIKRDLPVRQKNERKTRNSKLVESTWRQNSDSVLSDICSIRRNLVEWVRAQALSSKDALILHHDLLQKVLSDPIKKPGNSSCIEQTLCR